MKRNYIQKTHNFTISNKYYKLQIIIKVNYYDNGTYEVNNINIKTTNLKLDIAHIQELKAIIRDLINNIGGNHANNES